LLAKHTAAAAEFPNTGLQQSLQTSLLIMSNAAAAAEFPNTE